MSRIYKLVAWVKTWRGTPAAIPAPVPLPEDPPLVLDHDCGPPSRW